MAVVTLSKKKFEFSKTALKIMEAKMFTVLLFSLFKKSTTLPERFQK